MTVHEVSNISLSSSSYHNPFQIKKFCIVKTSQTVVRILPFDLSIILGYLLYNDYFHSMIVSISSSLLQIQFSGTVASNSILSIFIQKISFLLVHQISMFLTQRWKQSPRMDELCPVQTPFFSCIKNETAEAVSIKVQLLGISS